MSLLQSTIKRVAALEERQAVLKHACGQQFEAAHPADAMVFKGCVSYRNDDINYISMGNGINVKITRMDRAFCQVSFVDQNDAAVPIPANMQLVFQDDRTPVARVGQTLTWYSTPWLAYTPWLVIMHRC